MMIEYAVIAFGVITAWGGWLVWELNGNVRGLEEDSKVTFKKFKQEIAEFRRKQDLHLKFLEERIEKLESFVPLEPKEVKTSTVFNMIASEIKKKKNSL